MKFAERAMKEILGLYTSLVWFIWRNCRGVRIGLLGHLKRLIDCALDCDIVDRFKRPTDPSYRLAEQLLVSTHREGVVSLFARLFSATKFAPLLRGCCVLTAGVFHLNSV